MPWYFYIGAFLGTFILAFAMIVLIVAICAAIFEAGTQYVDSNLEAEEEIE